MKQFLFLVFCLCLITPSTSQTQHPEFANDRLTIKVENHQDIERFCLDQFPFDTYSINILRKTETGNTIAIKFDREIPVMEYLDKLNSSPKVIFAEPDYIGSTGGEQMIIPNDTYFETRQWGLYNTGVFSLSPASMDADIDMELAWEYTTGDENIIIAILDSGLKLDHAEVTDNLWYNPDEIVNGIDDDNNGFIDDVNTGWDFANEDNLPMDDFGHGTNVTGIIGAKGDNNLGFAGVNWNSKLMSLKVINNENFGFYSWWTDAIYYAVDNGAKVLNMSLGGSGFSESMKEAVDYAYENGVTIVACMMNTDSSVPFYPAAYDNTIAVGATNPNDERASPFFWNTESGSNFGPHIDLIAPGNFTYGLHYINGTSYGTYWGGTSQAAPHVAGVASLLLSIDPNITVDQIREIITSTTEDEVGKSTEDVPGFDNYHGHGRLNAYNALSQLVSVKNENEIFKNNISISPNPVNLNSALTIDWGDLEVKKLQIFDTRGNLIFSQKITDSKVNFIFNTEGIIPGMYLLSIEAIDRQPFVKRVYISE